MKQEEIEESIRLLMNDIRESIIANYANDYQIAYSETENKKVFGLYAEDFILTYNPETMLFNLSFAVSRHGHTVASLMCYILAYISPLEVKVIIEHYYDRKNARILYGQEAIDENHNDILTQRGHRKCPICEKVFEVEFIKESGFCFICDEDRQFIAWN